MSSNELRQELAEATANRDALFAKAVEAADAVVNELIEIMPHFWAKELAKTRDQNPSRTLELGANGVAAIKARLTELSENADGIVREQMGSEKEGWAHLLAPHDRSRLRRQYRSQKLWSDKGWRRIHGAVGPIYEEFGLLDGYQVDSWSRGGYELYPFSTRLPDEVDESIKAYSQVVAELATADHETIDLSSQLQKAEAQELWDES